MKITQIRNATLWVEYHNVKFLVDPWLGPKEYMPGFEGALHPEIRQPRTELPFPVQTVAQADAVILTHVHPDHWDAYAEEALQKDIPFFVQSETDQKYVAGKGFTRVSVLSEGGTSFRGVMLHKTSGQHGERAKVEPMCRQLGMPYEAMGVVMQAEGEKSLYLAGDTIFCEEVQQALHVYQPAVVIVNACAARVASGDRLIMDENDVLQTALAAPQAKIVASHMDEVSHASVTRAQLAAFAKQHRLDNLLIPADGETLAF